MHQLLYPKVWNGIQELAISFALNNPVQPAISGKQHQKAASVTVFLKSAKKASHGTTKPAAASAHQPSVYRQSTLMRLSVNANAFGTTLRLVHLMSTGMWLVVRASVFQHANVLTKGKAFSTGMHYHASVFAACRNQLTMIIYGTSPRAPTYWNPRFVHLASFGIRVPENVTSSHKSALNPTPGTLYLVNVSAILKMKALLLMKWSITVQPISNGIKTAANARHAQYKNAIL